MGGGWGGETERGCAPTARACSIRPCADPQTTLLRHLAEGLIPLPKFLNVVHVEQEITGDERSAIATILEADKEREWLLKVENLLCEAEDGDAMEKALNIRWLPLSPSPHHNPDPSPTLPGR